MRRVVVALAALAAGVDAFSPSRLFAPSTRSQARVNAMPLRMMVQDDNTAINRRSALITAGLLLSSVGAPASVHAEGPTTAVMTIDTFEGVKGDVVFELYPDLAPKTVAAFKQWADMGLYDGTAFHRVATFGSKGVLMGGDPITKEEKYCMDEKTCYSGNWYGPDGFVSSSKRSSKDDQGKKLRDAFGKGGPPGWRKDSLSKVKLEPEFGKIPHDKGVLSMRRFGAPDSAGSQFIITMSDMKEEMDGQFASFGKVTQGMDLLEKVLKVDTDGSTALTFDRDDKKMKSTWPAWNLPTTRQGVTKIVVK